MVSEGVERSVTKFKREYVDKHKYALLDSDVQFDEKGVCSLINRDDSVEQLDEEEKPIYYSYKDYAQLSVKNHKIYFYGSLVGYNPSDILIVFGPMLFEDSDGEHSNGFDAEATRNGIRITVFDNNNLLPWNVAEELYKEINLYENKRTLMMAPVMGEIT